MSPQPPSRLSVATPPRTKRPHEEPEQISDDFDMEADFEDPLANALYTQDGVPLAEALVFIALAISTLTKSLSDYSAKSLKISKFIAKQLQTIATSLATPEVTDSEREDDVSSTAAVIVAPESMLDQEVPH
jgi:hypothetical protein